MTAVAIARRRTGIGRLRPARRRLWLVPGLAIGLLANVVAASSHLGLAPLLVFGIAPHLTSLVGIGQPHAPGQVAPRAVPLFNAAHHPAGPLALLGLAVAGVLSPYWLAASLAWLGHIVVDRSAGGSLRDAPDAGMAEAVR